jgi:hypothetical protein
MAQERGTDDGETEATHGGDNHHWPAAVKTLPLGFVVERWAKVVAQRHGRILLRSL